MATDYTINVCADTKCAEDNVKNVGKEVDKVEQKTEQGAKSAKKAAKGIGAIGVALGAAFGGVLLKALGFVFDLLQKNQGVVDALAIGVKTIEILFAQLVTAAQPLIDIFKSAFEDPMQALTDLWDMVKGFFGNFSFLIDALELEWDAFLLKLEASWNYILGLFGDDEAAALATQQFAEANEKLAESARLQEEGWTAVGDKIVETFDKVVESTKNAIAASTAFVDAQNALALAEANLEKQRQVSLATIAEEKILRDDINASYEDRLAAAQRIGEEEQKLAAEEQRIAEEKLRLAKLDLDLTQTTIEDLAEISRLEGEAAAARKRSADLQKENQEKINQLNKQELQFQEGLISKEQEAADKRREFEISRIEDIDARFAAEQEFNQKKLDAELERIRKELEGVEKGSERYYQLKAEEVDAQNEFNQQKLENDAAYQDDKAKLEKKANDEALKEAKKLEQAKAAARIAIVGQTFAVLKEVAGENAEAQKAIAVAETIWNTAQAITSALTAPPPLSFILAGLTGALGAVQIAKILSTDVGGGTGAPSTAGAGAGSVPNQIPIRTQGAVDFQGAIDAGQDQAPKAFVVAEDVETQSAIDRNVVANASF